MRTLSHDELVREINRVYHEAEAAIYDVQHPEIFSRERKTWESLAAYLPKSEHGISILDVGSGTGFVPDMLRAFLTERDTVTLFDVSPRMLELAKKKLEGNVALSIFVVSEGEDLPFANNVFDAVTLNSVLHHIPDTAVFFGEARRVLKPGGVLMIAHEPNQLFFQNAFLCSVLWVLQKYAGFRARILRLFFPRRKHPSPSPYAGVYARVNDHLRSLGLVHGNISSEEIQKYVDVHSPTAGSVVDSAKGFVSSELMRRYLPNYETLYARTSSHMGKIDPTGSRIFAALDGLLGRLFPRAGSSFSVVFRKPLA